MHKIRSAIMSLVVLSLSSPAISAQIVKKEDMHLKKIGVITVSGSTTLDSVERKIMEKSQSMGATHYKITSITGNNKLNGTAIIYKQLPANS